MSLSVGDRIGSYEITARIGKGGMGEVYRARDLRLKRKVAVKTLPSSLSAAPARIQRFLRDAEVLASLNHPNIAQIHGMARGSFIASNLSTQMLLQRASDPPAVIPRP